MKPIVSRNLVVGALLAVSFSSLASAQAKLIAGWNFGQFISAGVPSTDGTTGDAVGSIPSNFSGSTRPTDDDSGPSHISSGTASTFSAGSGLVSFGAWDFTGGTDVSVVELGALSATNAQLVNGQFLYVGDVNNAHLRFNAGAVTDFTVSLNTVGFADFDPAVTTEPNDFNLSFAAYKNSGTLASIEWLFNGSSLATTSTASGSFGAFSVDLPAGFYGQANAVLTARVTGDIVIDNLQINGVASAVPEPSSYAAIAAVAGLVFAAGRRRRA